MDKNESLDPILNQVYARILAELDPWVIASYPEAGDLYRKLAAWVGVDPGYLILSPGSDGAIRLTFEAFVNEGDVVVHTMPTFAMYPVYCQIFGAKAIPIEYKATSGGPTLNLRELLATIKEHRPKLVCLPNPDSPTGTTIKPEDLHSILEESTAIGAMVLIDEAYHPFYDRTAVPLVASYSNLVIARTFAKAWGAAGLRVGYAVAGHAVTELLHKIKPMYEVSTIAVEIMKQMLSRADAMRASVERILSTKESFAVAMESMGYGVLRTQGNFIHVAFGVDSQLIHDMLADRVYYRKGFDHPALKGYTRFSIAPEDTMNKVVALIRTALRGRP